ncbi:hypothetical protein [Sphingobacterium faecium]|uniref:hypothetical protein n=1 Tax=Sphingobacterium faecium TaxID=34087 RepID=UPI003207DEDC
MKTLILSAAAIMLASAVSFAGTPETKGESKPEVNTSSAQVYHYASENTAENQFRNPSNWQPGPSSDPTCGLDDIKPCEMTANNASDLATKLGSRSNSQVLLITDSNRQ